MYTISKKPFCLRHNLLLRKLKIHFIYYSDYNNFKILILKLLDFSFVSLLHAAYTRFICKYSQTWATNHFRIMTTVYNCLILGVRFSTVKEQSNLSTTTTCRQRPLFLGPNGGHCTQVWLYTNYYFLRLSFPI
jgi:hypothetical protein